MYISKQSRECVTRLEFKLEAVKKAEWRECLIQGLANFLCKGLDGTYVRPYGHCHGYSNALVVREQLHTIHKQTGELFSKRPCLAGGGLDLAFGRCCVNFRSRPHFSTWRPTEVTWDFKLPGDCNVQPGLRTVRVRATFPKLDGAHRSSEELVKMQIPAQQVWGGA